MQAGLREDICEPSHKLTELHCGRILDDCGVVTTTEVNVNVVQEAYGVIIGRSGPYVCILLSI